MPTAQPAQAPAAQTPTAQQPAQAPAAPAVAAQARPYTGMCAPEVGAEAAEHRNAITSAIASGLTQRDTSACGLAARLAGVSMTLGRIALARTPSSRYSTASTSTNASTAALAVT